MVESGLVTPLVGLVAKRMVETLGLDSVDSAGSVTGDSIVVLSVKRGRAPSSRPG